MNNYKQSELDEKCVPPRLRSMYNVIILSKMFPLNLFSFPLSMFRCFYFFVFAHIIEWWKHIIMDNNLIIID